MHGLGTSIKVSDWSEVFREVNRVLKKGGSVEAVDRGNITNLGPHLKKYIDNQYRRNASSHSFQQHCRYGQPRPCLPLLIPVSFTPPVSTVRQKRIQSRSPWVSTAGSWVS
ncbi:hypothetical protein BC936DRAFT_146440 [Jimgerdemannia flammicorona]|uniref:Uncharacterized protein n=1 Tax=Jimgerdemannia flammicorona TaxID=994334 RepID=A0A433D7N1_9FUNG|nr:hypothetical protein BC936DRAFT_146440 [Jimgerdemannia flammicorona]